MRTGHCRTGGVDDDGGWTERKFQVPSGVVGRHRGLVVSRDTGEGTTSTPKWTEEFHTES